MENKTKTKLKILAASDIHGDARTAKKLATKAEKENVDLIVLCGDMMGFFETENIIKPFKEKNQKVIFIPGNHETNATANILASEYKIKNLHSYSAIYKNVGFFGAGGGDIGINLTSEDELFKTLKKAHEKLSTTKGIEKKIMITHMHPRDSLSEFSGFPGSTSIKKALQEFQPDILIHGHIHEASGIEETIGKTRVINVGKEGMIIEI